MIDIEEKMKREYKIGLAVLAIAIMSVAILGYYLTFDKDPDRPGDNEDKDLIVPSDKTSCEALGWDWVGEDVNIASAKNYCVPIDEKSCEALNGSWEYLGNSQYKFCNLPASDAGKDCSDCDECEGTCTVELSEEEWNKIANNETIYKTGKCSAWKFTSGGCRAFIINGKVETICIL